MSPRNVYKLEGGTYTESNADPSLIAIEYIGGNTYTITEDEAVALTAAGYGAYIATDGPDTWKLDSTFLSLTSTDYDLLGNPL
jgi:hypothetical protein